jgi:hypothetical protein
MAEVTPPIRPDRLNARAQAVSLSCESGKTRAVRYAFCGETRRLVKDDNREAPCVRAILSEHDFDSVGGASGREGFKRTAPRLPKCERPRSAVVSGTESAVVWRMRGGGVIHGVESSWASMTNSMLASPQGASEQYMYMPTSSLIVNAGCSSSSLVFLRMNREGV